MKKTLVLGIALLAIVACSTTTEQPEKKEMTVIQNTETVFVDGNLLLAEGVNWRADTDDFGSSHNSDAESIDTSSGHVAVEFNMYKKQEGQRWPFVELISETGQALTGAESITIEYKSTHQLKIKLSQSDFGPEGDGSYAHYEVKIPMAEEWTTATVVFGDFEQPSWAPNLLPLNLDNIEDIYLVPNIDAMVGGVANLEVRSLEIK